MKKISIIVLSMLLLLAAILPCNAALAPDEPISPLWDNISSVLSNMVFDGVEGCAAGIARKTSTSERTVATLTVYEYVDGDWVYIDSDTEDTTSHAAGCEVNFIGVVGREYKAVFDVTCYKDGVPESVQKIIYETC